MADDVKATLLLIFLYLFQNAFGQEVPRCEYFTAIPKEERPDLPVLDFTGVTWSQRPLLPPQDRDDVCMDNWLPAGTFGTQVIYIEEEIEGHVVIARLNYEGTSEPYVGTFLVGTRHLLNVVIRRIPDLENAWHLVVTERQDYETPEMRQYMFEVRAVDEAMVARVSLEVVNIDDNPPVIHAFEPCSVPELGEPRLTDCIYEVTDVDGEISTRFMTFALDSDRDDDLVFSIQAENVPNDWYTMVMTLRVNEPLDFERSALHIFSVTASDSFPNNHTVSIMAQVENVEHRPPRWAEIWAVQQFDEKTSQSFTVRSIDGDTGINKPIYYRLANNDSYPFFSIETLEGGRDGGIFHVEPIDRDALEQEVFQLSIVAYKADNESFSTEATIVIIVQDVNDQIPQPLFDEYEISIMEETPMTLNFDKEFGFHDRDLGEHAQYQVYLEDIFPPGAADAFYVAPEVGYQRQTFTMGTRNHNILDYEEPDFQFISLRVVAQDLHTPSFIGNITVYINLINWNDEEPIFSEANQVVAFDETEGKGYFVGRIRATDRDIDDRVIHTLMGNAIDYLTIDEETGDIHISTDDAFNFHRQSQLFVQIRADDTLGEPYHTTTSQLTIQLNDINNTPPTLRLPRGSPSVEENVPEGYQITNEITATDPDTTARLIFEIDWESSYATKQGRDTDPLEYYGCVEIETIYPAANHTGSAIGQVVVKEIREGVTIDFEEFEFLYLTVRVTDVNTVIGSDSDELTFTVMIIDMNDNPPVWAEGTLDTEFRVREVSASGVVIGSVLATDIDGPLYNQVRYTIFPREDSPDGLVKIDFYTGQIEVDANAAIDADDPPRQNLYYTVIASDRCYAEDPEECPPDPTYWDTPGNISIIIIDTNNKRPEALLAQFDTILYIYENATSGDEVVQLLTFDLDRDEIYHQVRYQMNYQINIRLRDFFVVDLDTGLVYVWYTTDDVLDRDGDEPQHRIFLTLFDNFYSEGDGNRNQDDLEVLVILLDVNDNAPELPPPDQLYWSISENLDEGIRLTPDIYAPDRDEPDTDNSRVGYAILSLMNKDKDEEPPKLFTMINIGNVTGEIETAMPMKGYWGTYDINILAYDHGIPQQSSNETYELVIRPYNYNAPYFLFPISGTTIRLAKELATTNSPLALVSGEFLGRIEAIDEDGLDAGIVSFEIIGNGNIYCTTDGAEEFFRILNDGENLATIILNQGIPEDVREFEVVIKATDGGTEPGPLSTESVINIIYVPTVGSPTFIITDVNIAFIEREAGMVEKHQLPLAQDPKNYRCMDDCHEVFYAIIDGNEDGYFYLDPRTNILTIIKELNRNEKDTHLLIIAASNTMDSLVNMGSTQTVTVTVREADPRPVFLRSLYTAGISTLDNINRELLNVQATQSEGFTITYSIDYTTMKADSSLEAVQNSAFNLNSNTGVLTLNMQPTALMHGMFEFEIVATDVVGATGRTEVRIYLISSVNRVYFLFYNTLDQVEINKDFIAQTFSSGFDMICNIDQIVPSADSNGVALEDITEVRAHFIKDDAPVLAEDIEVLRSDTPLLRSVQLILNTQLLILQDFVTGLSPEVSRDANLQTIFALSAITAVMTLLCLLLALIYFIRIRTLNRRLDALSTKRFGSVDSGVNKKHVLVPGTNKHAIAGSNPMWNEQLKMPDLDTYSHSSTDSDFVGIENLAQFQSNYFPTEEDMSQLVHPIEALPSHSNSFGYTNSNPRFSEDYKNPYSGKFF